MFNNILAFTMCCLICFSSARGQQSNDQAKPETKPASPKFAGGLLFYASFDRGNDPDYWSGSVVKQGRYSAAEGKLAGGWHGEGAALHYRALANVDRRVGTLAFWVKLDAEALKHEDGGSAELFDVPNANLVLGVLSHERLAFMTGSAPPGKDFAWDYSTTAPLPGSKGEWMHVALTWDASSGQKIIYINGKAAIITTRDFKGNGPADGEILIGPARGDYDELAIWDRVLSADEIKAIMSDPAKLAAAARALPPNVDANPWLIYPSLVVLPYERGMASPGETFSIALPLKNRTKEKLSARVILRAVDASNAQEGQAQSFDVTLDAGATTTIKAGFTPARLGIYRLEASVQAGPHVRQRDVCSFAVIPPGSPPRDLFFGTHVGGEAGIAESMRRIGFCQNRVHDMTQFTWWIRMEPERDMWAAPAKEYARYSDLGYTHFGEWFAAPYWAVKGQKPSGSGESYPKPWVPTDQEALAEYVRHSLQEYPAIKEWEVWNEPYVPMFWRGSAQEYVALCKTIYTAAKAARPDVTVYSQVEVEGPWTTSAFEAGLADACDGIAFHWYVHPDESPQEAAERPAKLRALIKKYSHKSLDAVPIIDSEGAMVSDSFLRGIDDPLLPPESKRPPSNAVQCAGNYVAICATMMANDVREFFYYCACPYSLEGAKFDLFDADNAPKPVAVAANQLMWQLNNGRFMQQVNDLPANLRACVFQRSDGTLLAIVWSENEAPVAVGNVDRAFDVWGNKLAGPIVLKKIMPIYIRGEGTAADFSKSIRALQVHVTTAPATSP